MRKFIALSAAVLALAGGAQAQTKKELVQKVLQLQQTAIENAGRGLAAQTVQQVAQATAVALQRLPADKREAAGRDAQAMIRKFHEEIEPVLREQAVKQAPLAIGPLLEERLSEAELKEVIAWLESPVSKKYDQIARDAAGALQQKLVEQTRGTVEPKLKALETGLQKRLGITPQRPASAPAGK